MPLRFGAGLAAAPATASAWSGATAPASPPAAQAGLVPEGDRFAQPGATIHNLPQEPDLSGFATMADLDRTRV